MLAFERLSLASKAKCITWWRKQPNLVGSVLIWDCLNINLQHLQKKTSTKQNKNPTQKKPKHKICMKDLIQKNLSVTLDSE